MRRPRDRDHAGWIDSLNNCMIELEVITACCHYGLGLLLGSLLGGGLLAGALAKTEAGRRDSERLQREMERHRAKN